MQTGSPTLKARSRTMHSPLHETFAHPILTSPNYLNLSFLMTLLTGSIHNNLLGSVVVFILFSVTSRYPSDHLI